MSNMSPPPGFPPTPPPPGGFGQQTPPFQSPGAPPAPHFPQAPPPMYQPNMPSGYTAYGQPGATGSVRSSTGLAKATIVLFWLVTAASGLLTLAFFSRKGKWNDYLAGSADLRDLKNADGFVGLSALLQIGLQVASVIMVSLWAKRVVDNARARGVPDVSPGLACGGWYIPIGWFWVGFSQLRKAVAGVRGTAASLTPWQIAFLVVGISGVVTRGFSGNINVGDSGSDVTDTLGRQGLVGLVSFALFIVTSVLAMKAIREADRAVSGPQR